MPDLQIVPPFNREVIETDLQTDLSSDDRDVRSASLMGDLADVLSEFARTMVTDFPIQRILDHLVERIVDILPISAAGVTLISAGSEPHYVAASDTSALEFERLQTELNEGPCVAAYYTGEAISVPDLRAETRFSQFAPRALEAGLAAVFTFPLHHNDLQLGALDLYRDAPGPLSAEAMRTAQTLADVAAAYLLNAQARSDLEDSSDRSREAAVHDALTGLPNRVLMLERLEHALLREQRSSKLSAVIFVDLDRFKAVNDTYGHQVGDQLLVSIADRLSRVLRPGDTLARLSGDEFVILCEELADPAQAEMLAARLDGVLARPFVLESLTVQMTASIGVAVSGPGQRDATELLHDADRAMYKRKRGRFSSPAMIAVDGLNDVNDRADLEQDLHGAAERDELILAYQPIVATADSRVTGVEALVRWMHPSRGLVAPCVLIPVADQSGLIVELGQWVIARASSDLRASDPRDTHDALGLSVNVSAHQFMSAGFIDTVAVVLDTGAIDPKSLTLEVTETIFFRDSERALSVLGTLKEMGVMLALDDFGTGYSSLSYLMRYPVDTIKLDQTFIAALGRDAATTAVMGAMIELAHGLGMSVVAEGVETTEQHDHLCRLGCDFCQGFYFARPMPASSLATLMQHSADGHPPRLPAESDDTNDEADRHRPISTRALHGGAPAERSERAPELASP